MDLNHGPLDLLLFPMSYEYSEEPFLFLNSSTTTLPHYSTSLLYYFNTVQGKNMRITIANAKGGVGKTTSSIYLAATATARGHEVVLLDADPQGSASQWAFMAENENDPLGFEVQAANPATLRRPQKENVMEIVDAAPTGQGLQAALETADFVIVPSSDSPLDVQQAWSTLSATDKPAAVLLVRVESGTRAMKAVMEAFNRWATPLFDAQIHKRQDIKTSMGHNPRKLWEYAQAWQEIELMMKGE
ncbi:AAA family ATPase [Bifidobacterium dentium]|uniref:nucleotide-binding protein n=2 Tax=Bifidobacterium dentium TaxID=1689 RepID=UPI00398C960A